MKLVVGGGEEASKPWEMFLLQQSLSTLGV